MHLSSLGLGCVTFGREIDQTAAFALMDHAWARGITFFDTAAAYGQGASERIVGAWRASRRPGEALVIGTKLLPPYTPERIAASVDESRRRLQTDTLDLLFFHRWDETAETPAALAALDRLVQSGVVRSLGVSNATAAQLQRGLQQQAAHGFASFRVLQNNHNLAVRDVDAPLRELCAAHDIAIVTYSPLGAGFLTGKHRQGAQPATRFTLIPGHQDVYFHETAFRRLDRLEALARRTGHSNVHLALAWALHQPGIASVLVGGRTPAHLDQAFAAQRLADPALLAELEDGGSPLTPEGGSDTSVTS